MAQRDKLRSAFGRSDARDLSHSEHVALFHQALANQRHRFGHQSHLTARDRDAFGIRLGSYINHVRLAAPVNMRKVLILFWHARIIQVVGL